MSGGEFNYDQYKIGEIADQIDDLIESGRIEAYARYQVDVIGEEGVEEILKHCAEAAGLSKRLFKMVHIIDWMISADDSPSTMLMRWRSELPKLEEK